MVRIAAIATVVLLASAAHAASPSLSEAAGHYRVATSGSSLAFAVGAASGPGIQGRFQRFEGSIDIPADHVERASVVITIDPGSVATGEPRVDNFLKSDAVFDTANEREIVFHSTRVTRTGEDSATVEGSLTARGRTFSETFDVRLVDFGPGSIRFKVTGRVLRSPYGMDVGTPIYSNVVDFDMDLTARRR